MGTSKAARTPFIDSIKGVAILMVIASHLPWAGITQLNLQFFPSFAVSMFFMTSAYLLTLQWQKEDFKPGYYWRYWQGKLKKLLVPYWLMVAFSWILLRSGFNLGPFTPGHVEIAASIPSLILHIFFLYGFSPFYSNGMFFGEWFLFCLLNFYLIFPLIWWSGGRTKKGSLLHGFFSLAVFLFLAWLIPREFFSQYPSILFPRYLFAFVLGIILAHRRAETEKMPSWLLFLFVISLLIVVKVWFFLPATILLGGTVFLLMERNAKPFSLLNNSILIWFGRHSYSLYLWNIWAVLFTQPFLRMMGIEPNFVMRLLVVGIFLGAGIVILEFLSEKIFDLVVKMKKHSMNY